MPSAIWTVSLQFANYNEGISKQISREERVTRTAEPSKNIITLAGRLAGWTRSAWKMLGKVPKSCYYTQSYLFTTFSTFLTESRKKIYVSNFFSNFLFIEIEFLLFRFYFMAEEKAKSALSQKRKILLDSPFHNLLKCLSSLHGAAWMF